jgi:hypothetical protein
MDTGERRPCWNGNEWGREDRRILQLTAVKQQRREDPSQWRPFPLPHFHSSAAEWKEWANCPQIAPNKMEAIYLLSSVGNYLKDWVKLYWMVVNCLRQTEKEAFTLHIYCGHERLSFPFSCPVKHGVGFNNAPSNADLEGMRIMGNKYVKM